MLKLIERPGFFINTAHEGVRGPHFGVSSLRGSTAVIILKGGRKHYNTYVHSKCLCVLTVYTNVHCTRTSYIAICTYTCTFEFLRNLKNSVCLPIFKLKSYL